MAQFRGKPRRGPVSTLVAGNTVLPAKDGDNTYCNVTSLLDDRAQALRDEMAEVTHLRERAEATLADARRIHFEAVAEAEQIRASSRGEVAHPIGAGAGAVDALSDPEIVKGRVIELTAELMALLHHNPGLANDLTPPPKERYRPRALIVVFSVAVVGLVISYLFK